MESWEISFSSYMKMSCMDNTWKLLEVWYKGTFIIHAYEEVDQYYAVYGLGTFMQLADS